MVRSIVVLLIGLSLISLGCKDASKAAPETDVTPSVMAKEANPSAPSVAKIVFLEKEKCCACTNTRQINSKAVVLTVLGDAKVQPVVSTVFLDTQESAAKSYLSMKPTMVPPGIYFLDANDVLVTHLQGEVTKEQVAKALKGK